MAADLDNSGALGLFEVAAAMARLARPGKAPRLEQVMDEFDENGDEELDFDEFGRLFIRLIELGVIARPEVD